MIAIFSLSLTTIVLGVSSLLTISKEYGISSNSTVYKNAYWGLWGSKLVNVNSLFPYQNNLSLLTH